MVIAGITWSRYQAMKAYRSVSRIWNSHTPTRGVPLLVSTAVLRPSPFISASSMRPMPSGAAATETRHDGQKKAG
eukprot:5764712-Pleurochrysis_carterae.AAC.1